MVRAQTGYKSARGRRSPAQARLLPYQRTVKRMDDYYENRDGRPGYCWCGCGEMTGVASATDARRSRFEGEHLAFLPGHHARLQKPKGTVPPEKVETIRHLHNNSPMKSPEIAALVGLSASFTREIARNNVRAYYDPDYQPIGHDERMKLIYPHDILACVICGATFESKGPRRRRNTCGKKECFIEFRKINAPPSTEQSRAKQSEKQKANHAAGRYADANWASSRAQVEWKDRLPSEKPEWMDRRRWDAIYMHVAEEVRYEDMARTLGGNPQRYKHRVRRAIEDLERGGPKPVDNTNRREAALGRWRNTRESL